MTAELSRRLARAVNALSMTDLPRVRRVELARESQRCDLFDELPQWIKNVVEKAENS